MAKRGESLAADVQELLVGHLHQVLQGTAQGIVLVKSVVPFPALRDIQTQRLVLHLRHLGEIVVEVGDAVALGGVERAVGRNQNWNLIPAPVKPVISLASEKSALKIGFLKVQNW